MNEEFQLNFNQHIPNQKKIEKKYNKTKSNWEGIPLNPPNSSITIIRVKRKREEEPLEKIYINSKSLLQKKRKLTDYFSELKISDDDLRKMWVFKETPKKRLNSILERKKLKSVLNLSDIKRKRIIQHGELLRKRKLIRVREKRDGNIQVIDFQTNGALTSENLNNDDYHTDYYTFNEEVEMRDEEVKKLDSEMESFCFDEDCEYDIEDDNLSDDENHEDFYANSYPQEPLDSSSESDDDEKEEEGEEEDDEEDINYVREEEEFLDFVERLENGKIIENEENIMDIDNNDNSMDVDS